MNTVIQDNEQLVQMVTQLKISQKRRLRLLSERTTRPMSEFIREGVDTVLLRYPQAEQDLPPAA